MLEIRNQDVGRAMFSLEVLGKSASSTHFSLWLLPAIFVVPWRRGASPLSLPPLSSLAFSLDVSFSVSSPLLLKIPSHRIQVPAYSSLVAF